MSRHSEGRVELKRFDATVRCASIDSISNPEGNRPEKEFPERSSKLRDDSCPRDGSDPEKRFDATSSDVRVDSCQTPGGNGPVKKL
jgi:hypothetical protein